MTPKEFSSELLRVASGIERAKKPSLTLVRKDIAKILASLQEDRRRAAVKRIATVMIRLAQGQVEDTSLWSTDEGEDVDFTWKETRLKEDPEQLEASLKLLKRDIDSFIGEITRDPTKKKPSTSEPDDVFTSAK